ncbi:MAG: N-methyl-L-tryptophan oxidase [Candidatus Eremiobacteraeota bacterium]|nr:N-methyl-L-tryptophan oxidase [Candidatus Eremiobacteraeota bacterium]
MGERVVHVVIIADGAEKVYPNPAVKRVREGSRLTMYDSIIIGLGGMGSAAAAHLAQRGQRVLGLEQFSPVHALGSSHGQTRIIRQAYFEHPAYVPLLLRAYELWHDLESRCGETLLVRTGGLLVGNESSPLVAGSLRSVRDHGLAHEVFDATGLYKRFPAMHPQPDEIGVFELPAGMLFPERCVRAHLDWAAAAGAELRFDTPVVRWGATPDGAVWVTTADGRRFEAASLMLCAGAWLQRYAADIGLPIRVERNVMHWFAPQPDADVARLAALPVFIVDRRKGDLLYGVPFIQGQGLKAAFHHSHRYTSPDGLQRDVDPAEACGVHEALRAWIPDAAGERITSVACMYTMTPDEHFIIGRHPAHAAVILAGGFSGHGFKFCSVVGEILAQLAIDGEPVHSIALFSPTRFGSARAQ